MPSSTEQVQLVEPAGWKRMEEKGAIKRCYPILPFYHNIGRKSIGTVAPKNFFFDPVMGSEHIKQGVINFHGVGCILGSELRENVRKEMCFGKGLMFNMKHEKIWPNILAKIGAKENSFHTV